MDPSLRGSQANNKMAEFPELGKHCEVETCQQLGTLVWDNQSWLFLFSARVGYLLWLFDLQIFFLFFAIGALVRFGK